MQQDGQINYTNQHLCGMVPTNIISLLHVSTWDQLRKSVKGCQHVVHRSIGCLKAKQEN